MYSTFGTGTGSKIILSTKMMIRKTWGVHGNIFKLWSSGFRRLHCTTAC